jgi:taurine dioxygenase
MMIVQLFVLLLLSFHLPVYLMTITPLTGLKDYVAEIRGVSVERITEEQFNQIHQALLKYKVVVVRDQGDLSIEGQRNFTKRFGRLHIHLESSSHLPGYQDVNVVSNMKVNGSHIGLFGKHVENFHADLSWHSLPAKITVLKSVIRPDQCGDTEFTNTIAAYDHLPSYLKKALTGKTANYCYLKLREIDANGQVENLNADELEGANRCAVHPIFTTHPITGQRNIFANPSDTSQINNMTFSESEQLLQQLFQHTADQRFIYRHQYQDNDFVLWDNRGK